MNIITEDEGRFYKPIELVIASETESDYLISSAKKQLKGWLERFESLSVVCGESYTMIRKALDKM